MNVQIVKEYPSPFGSDNVVLMRGYSKPQSTSAISSSDSLNAAIGKLEKAIESGGGSSDPYDGRKTRYTISSSNWSSSPNSDGYYTYSLTLTNPLSTSTSPNVYIAGASDSTQPTATESTMFSYVKRCNLSSTTTLVLYASTKPTSTFYVFVGAESGNGEFVFSATEHIVGTWYGKTLYAKTYTTYANTYDSGNQTLYPLWPSGGLGIDPTKIKDIKIHPIIMSGKAYVNYPQNRLLTVYENGAGLELYETAPFSSREGTTRDITIYYTKS